MVDGVGCVENNNVTQHVLCHGDALLRSCAEIGKWKLSALRIATPVGGELVPALGQETVSLCVEAESPFETADDVAMS
jgi:hypothetical protein